MSAGIEILVRSGAGMNRAPDIEDKIIGSESAALATGQALLDLNGASRLVVTGTCAVRAAAPVPMPGAVVEVWDTEAGVNKGMLRRWRTTWKRDGAGVTADREVTIERILEGLS